MRYLNLGCGHHYAKGPEWTNLDFESTGPGVIGHNLLQGIPFGDNSFDLVYHSHVLEHFSRADGRRFLEACFRVLKPGGTLRIAVPDLEGIVRHYLRFLEAGMADPANPETRANYEWMLLEMYDQTVRNRPGGDMGRYLAADELPNEAFVFGRIGEEGRAFRAMIRNRKPAAEQPENTGRTGIRDRVRTLLLKALGLTRQQAEIGRFRTGGEIHQWMYDRFSLGNLLADLGAKEIVVRDAFSSTISNWAAYELDAIAGTVRKPDSLFVEAIKP